MQIRSLFLIFILFVLTVSATPIDKRDALAGNYMIQLTIDFIAFFIISHVRNDNRVDKT